MTISHRILPNGNLLLTADNEARRDLALDWQEHHDWQELWSNIMGDFEATGSLYEVGPEAIGALTDSPIVTDDLSDDGEPLTGRIWWFPNYQIVDPLEELRRYGRVEFTAAEDAK